MYNIINPVNYLIAKFTSSGISDIKQLLLCVLFLGIFVFTRIFSSIFEKLSHYIGYQLREEDLYFSVLLFYSLLINIIMYVYGTQYGIWIHIESIYCSISVISISTSFLFLYVWSLPAPLFQFFINYITGHCEPLSP